MYPKTVCLKARLRKPLSDTCSARKRKARDVLFQPLGYLRPVSSFCVTSDINLQKEKEEVTQAQEKLLKRPKSRKELELFCSRTCADLSLLQLNKCERNKDEIVAEELFSLPSERPAVQYYSARERAETLRLSRNDSEVLLGRMKLKDKLRFSVMITVFWY